ncbi:MAG: 3-hydroxyisobutyrate dehydrogenase [Glaciecola sp.]|jgi:3-hydroxyisobutyrate dehydrogenase
MQLAFIGLGAMGFPMAANLAAHHDVLVHNRTRAIADRHAEAHGTKSVSLDQLGGVEVLLTCLPTTAVVKMVADELVGVLAAGTLWIDCTSGDPEASRALASELAERGVTYVDAPVSGGTNGAEAGTLTIMVGGPAQDVARARPILEPMAGLIVEVGPVGAGHAVKAVNNTLLAANLVTATEGLLALQALGIDPMAAVEVLNHSSGRSFATEHPLPERVITRSFPNTFALGLLHKDVGLGLAVLDAAGDPAPALRAVADVLEAARAHSGGEVDHTELVRIIEHGAGRELKSSAALPI